MQFDYSSNHKGGAEQGDPVRRVDAKRTTNEVATATKGWLASNVADDEWSGQYETRNTKKDLDADSQLIQHPGNDDIEAPNCETGSVFCGADVREKNRESGKSTKTVDTGKVAIGTR